MLTISTLPLFVIYTPGRFSLKSKKWTILSVSYMISAAQQIHICKDEPAFLHLVSYLSHLFMNKLCMWRDDMNSPNQHATQARVLCVLYVLPCAFLWFLNCVHSIHSWIILSACVLTPAWISGNKSWIEHFEFSRLHLAFSHSQRDTFNRSLQYLLPFYSMHPFYRRREWYKAEKKEIREKGVWIRVRNSIRVSALLLLQLQLCHLVFMCSRILCLCKELHHFTPWAWEHWDLTRWAQTIYW